MKTSKAALRDISKAVAALDYASWGVGETDKRAFEEAYRLLRIMILGGNGYDLAAPYKSRLKKEGGIEP
jgi:hypothetical protein